MSTKRSLTSNEIERTTKKARPSILDKLLLPHLNDQNVLDHSSKQTPIRQSISPVSIIEQSNQSQPIILNLDSKQIENSTVIEKQNSESTSTTIISSSEEPSTTIQASPKKSTTIVDAPIENVENQVVSRKSPQHQLKNRLSHFGGSAAIVDSPSFARLMFIPDEAPVVVAQPTTPVSEKVQIEQQPQPQEQEIQQPQPQEQVVETDVKIDSTNVVMSEAISETDNKVSDQSVKPEEPQQPEQQEQEMQTEEVQVSIEVVESNIAQVEKEIEQLEKQIQVEESPQTEQIEQKQQIEQIESVAVAPPTEQIQIVQEEIKPIVEEPIVQQPQPEEIETQEKQEEKHDESLSEIDLDDEKEQKEEKEEEMEDSCSEHDDCVMESIPLFEDDDEEQDIDEWSSNETAQTEFFAAKLKDGVENQVLLSPSFLRSLFNNDEEEHSNCANEAPVTPMPQKRSTSLLKVTRNLNEAWNEIDEILSLSPSTPVGARSPSPAKAHFQQTTPVSRKISEKKIAQKQQEKLMMQTPQPTQKSTTTTTSSKQVIDNEALQLLSRTRNNVRHELLETERLYISQLRLLVDQYKPMFEKAKVSEFEQRAVFSVLQNLVLMNEVLLDMLIKKPHDIGSVFLKLMQYFKMYTTYFQGYLNGVETVLSLSKNKKFSQELSNLEHKLDKEKSGHNVTKLRDLMIVPIQRIPRYKLLLDSLRRATPDTDPHLDSLIAAQESISDIAMDLNQRIGNHEQRAHVMEIQQKFDKKLKSKVDFPKLVEPHRACFKEGKAKFKNVTETNKKKIDSIAAKHTCGVYLFNDLLIVSKRKEKETEEDPFLWTKLEDLFVKADGSYLFLFDFERIQGCLVFATPNEAKAWETAICRKIADLPVGTASKAEQRARAKFDKDELGVWDVIFTAPSFAQRRTVQQFEEEKKRSEEVLMDLANNMKVPQTPKRNPVLSLIASTTMSAKKLVSPGPSAATPSHHHLNHHHQSTQLPNRFLNFLSSPMKGNNNSNNENNNYAQVVNDKLNDALLNKL